MMTRSWQVDNGDDQRWRKSLWWWWWVLFCFEVEGHVILFSPLTNVFFFLLFYFSFFFFSKRYHLTHFNWPMVHDTGALMVRKQVKSDRITPSKGAKCTCHWPIKWCHVTHLFFIMKKGKWSLWSNVVTMVMT